MSFTEFIVSNFNEFLTYTGFANATIPNLIMIAVGAFFIWLAIKKDFEPLLLVPIGLGIILGNIPFRADAGLEIGLYEDNSVLNIFYQGLGIGAMTDFSALLANPKLMLVGAAAQFGIFGAYMIALALGFMPDQAGAIAIIGGADGPTAIFLSSKTAPNLMGAIAVCAYSYMALVPVIQPLVMRLMTTKKERLIRMKPVRHVSQTERILFPIIGLLLTTFIVPSGLPLLGMLFFGNLLKESGKTTRLAKTAGSALNDIVVIGQMTGEKPEVTTIEYTNSNNKQALKTWIVKGVSFAACNILFTFPAENGTAFTFFTNNNAAKDIPLLKEIVGKQWKKEDELKGLKSELAALDRKIQLELAKDNEPQQQQAVANGDDVVEVSSQKETPSKGLKP